MKAVLLAATAAIAASSDLRVHGQRPLCAEVESGACQCENGNQIDEYRAMDAKCFLGNNAEGQPITFAFYPWLEAKHNCPVIGTIPAKKLQSIWAEAQECWADQNPCDNLPETGVSGAFEKCAEVAAKADMDEEVNGEDEEPAKAIPKDPKLERSQPALKEALATGKGSSIFQEPTPFDKAFSTEKSILDSLWHDKNQEAKSLGSAMGSDDGSIHFAGSAVGPSIKDEEFEHESRYLATKEFDVEGGGVVTYYVKYNDPKSPGGQQCVDKVDAMLKEFARQKRCEDEKKAREACENSAATVCNTHGNPIYESGCANNDVWLTGGANTGAKLQAGEMVAAACDDGSAQWTCTNPNKFGTNVMSRCNHCACESSFEGEHCTRSFVGAPRWSRSVGDPHPNTYNGLYTNLYDGGEFIWWRHPSIPMEAHLTTRPVWGVAVNKDFSIKRCKSVAKTAPCSGLQCYPDMVAPCEVITRGASSIQYTIKKDGSYVCGRLLYGCVGNSGRSLITKSCNEMAEYNSAYMQLNWGTGFYKDSYLWVKSLRDGKGGGIGGHWGGSDYGDTISTSGTRGRSRMYSETFYNNYRITDAKKSHWGHGCGGGLTSGSLNGRRSLIEEGAGTKTALRKAATKKTRARSGAEMDKMVEQMFSSVHIKLEEMGDGDIKAADPNNKKLVGGCDIKDEVVGNTVCSATATKWCTEHIQECTGMATPDAAALAACVKDMVKIGNTASGKEKTLKLACEIVKEDFENEVEMAVDQAKEEKQELAEAWPLLLPAATDMVLQYCVKGCDAEESQKCKDLREDPEKAVALDKKHPVKEMNKACSTGTESEGGWKTFKSIQMKEYGEDITSVFKRFTSRIPEEASAMAKKHNGGKLRIRFYQHSHSTCFCCNAVAIDQISVQTGGWPVRIIADQRFELYADGKKIGDGEWAKRENSIDVNRFRIPTTSQVIGIWIEGVPKARDGRKPEETSAMSGVLASIADSLVTSASWSCTSVGVGGETWRMDASKREVKDWLTWPMAAELGTNDPGTDPWGQVPGIALSSRWIYSHSTAQNKKTTAYCRIDTDHAWLSYSKVHPTSTRWSCKNRADLQSPFVIALSNNTRFSFPGRQVGTQDKSTSFSSSGDGWTTLKNRAEGDTIVEERAMFLRLSLKDIMENATDGSLVKVAMLRLYTDKAGVPLKLCNIGAKGEELKSNWKTVTYETVKSAPSTGCLDAVSLKDDFVKIDVSNWVRGWRTVPSANIGVLITTTSKDGVAVAAPDMDAKNADLRPRLSLACHGDQADPTMVFKRTGVKVVAHGNDGKVNGNDGKVNAVWPKGLHDESWLEHAKLPEKFWTSTTRE